MISFHKLLPEEGVEHNDVVLKYRHTLPNGSLVWAGMTAMVESNALWNKMVNNLGGQSPVLGVFFERETRIEDLESMPTALYLRTDRETINRHTVPQTYQVRSRLK